MQVLGLSYPKSGRTWLRVMLGHLFCSEHGLPLERALNPPGGPLVWSHGGAEMLRRGSRLDRLRRIAADSECWPVLWLLRDPAATMQSAYFQATSRRRIFVGDFSAFLRDPDFGIRFWKRWHEAWAERLGERRGLLLRYEDLRADPSRQLRRVASALGWRPADRAIAAAVAFGRFENMQRLERTKFFAEPALHAVGRTPAGRKARQGGSGPVRLRPADARYLAAVLGAEAIGAFPFPGPVRALADRITWPGTAFEDCDGNPAGHRKI